MDEYLFLTDLSAPTVPVVVAPVAVGMEEGRLAGKGTSAGDKKLTSPPSGTHTVNNNELPFSLDEYGAINTDKPLPLLLLLLLLLLLWWSLSAEGMGEGRYCVLLRRLAGSSISPRSSD